MESQPKFSVSLHLCHLTRYRGKTWKNSVRFFNTKIKCIKSILFFSWSNNGDLYLHRDLHVDYSYPVYFEVKGSLFFLCSLDIHKWWCVSADCQPTNLCFPIGRQTEVWSCNLGHSPSVGVSAGGRVGRICFRIFRAKPLGCVCPQPECEVLKPEKWKWSIRWS